MNVPFVDLKAQHFPLQEDLKDAMFAVMERGDFALGKDVKLLEEEFASYCGSKYAVGVDSGLSALELCLHAFEIGKGDEVIVPAHTFVASAAAVTFTGATPVLVDVEPNSYNLDVNQLEAAITTRTRAIIAVHLYGLPAKMDSIMAIAKKHDLVVIEDAAQSHGARYNGNLTGSLGHAAAFSFYPTKNLGGFGDGGMITTDNEQVVEKLCALRNCGQRQKNLHELSPFNHRLDTLQAAVLRVKLNHLDEWNDARRHAASIYNELFRGSEIITPVEQDGSRHVYHLYVIRSSRRDALKAFLWEQGIGTGIHYPLPIHLQPYYAKNGFQDTQYPNAEELCNEILSLPMFPTITGEQIGYVVDQIARFHQNVPATETEASPVT